MSGTKLNRLKDTLRGYGSCLVAYSGGVDSAFLARVAHDALGDRCLAVLADSPSLPREELAEAVALAEREGFPLRIVATREFDNPDYLSNPSNRCFFCKHELFTVLEPLARSLDLAVIAYGENASDTGDFRPGALAAAQFQVRAPLKECGLTKDEIRAYSRELGLPTAEKPQMACLSSRIPYGETVSPEKLRMIEGAEKALRDLGFRDVRVRHHELRGNDPNSGEGQGDGGGLVRHLARIEVGLSELPRLADGDLGKAVAAALRALGYWHVTVDLEGYRRGSLNAGLASAGTGAG